MLGVLEGYVTPQRNARVTDTPNVPFGKIKELSGTVVRDVGLDFIARFCDEIGLVCEFPAHQRTMRSWQYPWDLKINGATFALKTSTERADGRFQFNHIRPHRSYEAVLCLGIAPDTVLFDAWSKPDIARETSGKPVAIDQMPPTWTMRKHRGELKPIGQFERHINLLTKTLVSSRYRSHSETERREMDLLVSLGLHDVPHDGKSLQETMMEVSRNAQKRGLTPDILRSILDET